MPKRNNDDINNNDDSSTITSLDSNKQLKKHQKKEPTNINFAELLNSIFDNTSTHSTALLPPPPSQTIENNILQTTQPKTTPQTTPQNITLIFGNQSNYKMPTTTTIEYSIETEDDSDDDADDDDEDADDEDEDDADEDEDTDDETTPTAPTHADKENIKINKQEIAPAPAQAPDGNVERYYDHNDKEFRELLNLRKHITENIEKNPKNKHLNKSLKICNKSIESYIEETRKKNVKKYGELATYRNQTNFSSEVEYFKTKLSSIEQQTLLHEMQKIKTLTHIEKPFRINILQSKIPLNSKIIAFEKLNSLKQMCKHDTDYRKLEHWLETFMKIPFGIYKSLSIKLEDGLDVTDEFLNNAKQILDNCTYGLEDSKMQIMQLLGNLITNPDAVGNSIAINGPMGTGKCHGFGTPILMYDGDAKMVQDIVVGDIVMGADSTPRTVLSLGCGIDEMYLVEHTNGAGYYEANSEHILCLYKHNATTDKFEKHHICIKDFLLLPVEDQRTYYGYQCGTFIDSLEKTTQDTMQDTMQDIIFGNSLVENINSAEFIAQDSIPDEYKINYPQRLELLHKILNEIGELYIDSEKSVIEQLNDLKRSPNPNMDIKYVVKCNETNEKFYNDLIYLARAVGYLVVECRCFCKYYDDNVGEYITFYLNRSTYSNISVTSLGLGNYYGFELDGDHEYLLGNFIVTHNTTLIKDGISKIMEREFVFIPLGGASDGSYLEGHSYTYVGSTWGKIVQSLIECKCMNPVIYFDELDKVSDSNKGQEIINILTHLTDTTQNMEFHDKYFSELSFDLSKCLFIFSYNDETLINPILRDRMYKIKTSGYDLKEKKIIAKNYLLQGIQKQVNLTDDDIIIPDDTLDYIINSPALSNKEAGVRNLKRCLETIYRKINLFRLVKPENKIFNDMLDLEVKFPITITRKHIDLLIKTEPQNQSLLAMYV